MNSGRVLEKFDVQNRTGFAEYEIASFLKAMPNLELNDNGIIKDANVLAEVVAFDLVEREFNECHWGT